jgi:hypothetical protein
LGVSCELLGGTFSAMSDTASFVQFPHPRNEHRPRSSHMSWNTGRHGRKFLLSPARYVVDDDHCQVGEVVFWGEWEAPSRIERRWLAEGKEAAKVMILVDLARAGWNDRDAVKACMANFLLTSSSWLVRAGLPGLACGPRRGP